MDTGEAPKTEILKYEDFETLRCDRCKEYLNCPNIMVYIDSAGVKRSYTECGRCYKTENDRLTSFKVVRNTSAETLAAITPFPCRYYCNGCRERRIWPKINLHEHECMFRVFEGILFNDNISLCATGVDIVKKYQELYPNLVLYDGVIPLTFDNSFEQPFLVQQNSDLFTCRIKYDVTTDKVWFIILLLEKKNSIVCHIEFSDETKNSVTLKIEANAKEQPIDFKGIKALLCDEVSSIKCRVYLNMRFLTSCSLQLLKEIQCPSCWDYMKGRIYVCSNGHSICAECTKSLTNCPVCREAEIKTTRNYSLERVISQAFFPCKNHTEGCTYISTLDEVMYHQTNCKYDCEE